MGHVPSGPFRQARQGHDVPRRQHRGAGALSGDLSARKRRLARLGEDVAAAFLVRRGAVIEGRNIGVGRGEIDLLVRLNRRLVAVEVKTVGANAATASPVDRLTSDKLTQMRRAAAQVSDESVRIDFVGVAVETDGVMVNWRPAIV